MFLHNKVKHLDCIQFFNEPLPDYKNTFNHESQFIDTIRKWHNHMYMYSDWHLLLDITQIIVN